MISASTTLRPDLRPIRLMSCDFFGYAWGTPPDFRPYPRYDAELRIVREAYREMAEICDSIPQHQEGLPQK